ncbi:hypothetical protein [Brytella acorum]|uniref:Lipoprotein n=1 Tax=Brytella acorum TaxID=2959299 RepID=A0AA35URD8_9PROT|nr:hypothetical protein [Brytella acorum]MDF3623840.1 hypothetical protein [Brytella acorum]CAI9120756.1 hypothetical protein LMG32879_001595 [Brytella acorum]
MWRRSSVALAFTVLASMQPLFAAPAVKGRHAASGTKSLAQVADPVVMTPHPGTDLDTQARALLSDDIADAKAHHDAPAVLTASAPLSNAKDDMALFVQLQSGWLCGSAGCTTSVYLRHKNQWHEVLDSVSGNIAVLPTRHQGMRDLLISGDDRWIWQGNGYQDTAPTAPLGNLKQSIERHQEKMGKRD